MLRGKEKRTPNKRKQREAIILGINHPHGDDKIAQNRPASLVPKKLARHAAVIRAGAVHTKHVQRTSWR